MYKNNFLFFNYDIFILKLLEKTKKYYFNKKHVKTETEAMRNTGQLFCFVFIYKSI
jgi:hypothetical protein